ncbi:hypothetical protein [Plantactinospora sp. KBS50]|uniref:hypothetical protein n=1 Tax=Plantactinospora sp. KBS50 TaxID=2024580 RepID=UPI000BAAA717|nr:hypothetical protein [Plantactinospora sp. KBS50]ASW54894.1 hypothetical protein CIK06_12900 [Plantactinospora sp. KBS50]
MTASSPPAGAARPVVLGRPADAGFLLIPPVALVFTAAIVLATVITATIPLGGGTAGWLGPLDPYPGSARNGAALQVMLLVGLLLAATLPRRLAGPLAAAGVLAVGLVCAVGATVDLAGVGRGLRGDLMRYAQGSCSAGTRRSPGW